MARTQPADHRTPLRNQPIPHFQPPANRVISIGLLVGNLTPSGRTERQYRTVRGRRRVTRGGSFSGLLLGHAKTVTRPVRRRHF